MYAENCTCERLYILHGVPACMHGVNKSIDGCAGESNAYTVNQSKEKSNAYTDMDDCTIF